MPVQDGEEYRVLVVDDEPVIADTLALILKRSGFTVMVAYSGESALDQALAWRPAALISDVVMPGLNGIETARGVLELLPECHVILFSGHGTLDVIHQAGENPFVVLPKPVHPEELLQRLRAFQTDSNLPETHRR